MTEPMAVLLETDAVVAVDKPPGLTVVPAPTEPGDSLRHRVERALGCPLWVVHRLDRDASGVVLFARSADAHRALCLAFEHRLVEKSYVALTAGVPDPPEGVIAVPLHAARRGKTRPAAPGEAGAQEATTGYEVVERWHRDGHRAALVSARPRTGRHHQLRVHFRSIGTPLLFDRVYGRRVDLAPLDGIPCQRLALHASRLVVPATVLGTRIDVHAPMAADLQAAIGWLANTWSRD